MIEVELRRIGEAALDELIDYAEDLKHDMVRGAETPELAALLVQKYGHGLAKGLTLAGKIVGLPAPDLIRDVDRLVAGIDPHWRENQKRLFSARPAALTLQGENL